MTDQAQHGEPAEGMCCLVTMEDITMENYVEYRVGDTWKPALFEESVVRQLLQSQFEDYIIRVKKTDCQAELKRLLAKGPPVTIADEHGLPLEEGETVEELWFASSNTIESAVLEGAKQGQDRQVLWDELKEFIVVEGKEEGDDAEEDKL